MFTIDQGRNWWGLCAFIGFIDSLQKDNENLQQSEAEEWWGFWLKNRKNRVITEIAYQAWIDGGLNEETTEGIYGLN